MRSSSCALRAACRSGELSSFSFISILSISRYVAISLIFDAMILRFLRLFSSSACWMGMTCPARLTDTSFSFFHLYHALRPIATPTSAKYGTPFFVNWRSFDSFACFSVSCKLVVFQQLVRSELPRSNKRMKAMFFQSLG